MGHLNVDLFVKNVPKRYGMLTSKHGLHVHTSGDISRGCDSMGPHFNPYKSPHGAPWMPPSHRHVGDFGNVVRRADGTIRARFGDYLATLYGPNSIIGRGLVAERLDFLQDGIDLYESLTRKLNHLDARLKTNEKEFTYTHDLEARIADLEAHSSDQEKVMAKQQNEIERLRALLWGNSAALNRTMSVEETINSGRTLRYVNMQSPVAFSTLLDHNVDHAGIEETLIFNKVLLNDGNAYNKQTGVFTVPRDGVYLFYFAFAAGYAPHKLWMHLVVNGHGEPAGVADNLQKSHDTQGGNLAILHLHRGDTIWVATFFYDDVGIYGSRALTSFSGVLLYEY